MYEDITIRNTPNKTNGKYIIRKANIFNKIRQTSFFIFLEKSFASILYYYWVVPSTYMWKFIRFPLTLQFPNDRFRLDLHGG